MSDPLFPGNRRFTWFTSAGRRATQYEAYTIGQQPNLEPWLHVDWPVRFDDGRPPWAAESTAARCSRWGEFRDPTQTWQRPYVAQHNHHEQALAALVPEAMRWGLSETIVPVWRDVVLGRYYAAWPFVEYGEFRCLCYAVRQALADTITFSLAFEVSDKARHSQDIIHYLLTLKKTHEGFSDESARGAWLTDPVLVPLRETIERVHSLSDWVEIAVAINLVLEPLAGDLFKTEFLARLAPLNGDAVTPIILASVRRDGERHIAATKALVRLLTGDPVHGESNRELVRAWVAKWQPHAHTAANALGALFVLDGITSIPFAPQLERVLSRQREVLAGLGLEMGDST
ncbi:MAG TPA: hypothetical protein VFK05_17445 [Polyangiaceae bacterium]|nr:hypothetical protein [Polyangiaceae bacterium]